MRVMEVVRFKRTKRMKHERLSWPLALGNGMGLLYLSSSMIDAAFTFEALGSPHVMTVIELEGKIVNRQCLRSAPGY